MAAAPRAEETTLADGPRRDQGVSLCGKGSGDNLPPPRRL